MFDRIPFDQKNILYINLILIVGLISANAFKIDTDPKSLNENSLKVVMRVFPLWLTVGLAVILIYSAVVFINYTYFNSPLEDKPDMTKVLTKMNKGASAATMFFYAATFGFIYLKWKLKKAEKNEITENNWGNGSLVSENIGKI